VSNILLTGSTGFIGSNILQSILKNNRVYIILRNKKKNKYQFKGNIKILKFKNYNELNRKLKNIRVDTVIHAAAHYVKKHSFEDVKKLAESNILLGNIILENIHKMKVKKFINFSTVWENNDNTNNFTNLYSVYKKGFSSILEYYKKKLLKIKFYELLLSDTFGKNDKRPKIINTLKKNYKKGQITKITSKNLYLNLLNVEDIVQAVDIILKKKIIPNRYVLKNSKNLKIFNLITTFNKENRKKIKVIWQSKKMIKNKIYSYNKLKNWKPKKSNINDIINLIK